MKKLNKFFAILVALAMMATLCVSMAFAEFTDNLPAGDNASEDASQAYLVKYLKIKEGVTIPVDDEYAFTFTPVASTTVTAADITEYGNRIIPQQIKITAGDMTPSDSSNDDGALVYAKSIAEIFENIDFPKAGEYVYDVAEVLPTAATDDIGTYTSNTQTYRLRIFVERQLKVIGYEEETGDPIYGTEYETVINKVTVQDETTKKDIEIDDPSIIEVTTETPGETTQKELTQEEITPTTVEGFTYVNKYDLKSAYEPDGDYGAFHTKKITTGAYGDDTQAFPITITVAFPSDYTKGDKALDVYKYVANGEDTLLGELVKDADPATTWSYTADLANGEIAYFKNLPEGAVVTVSENLIGSTINNAAYYNQSTTSKEGDAALAAVTTMYKADNTAFDGLKTKDTAVLTKITATDVTYHDANAKKDNNVEVTNASVYEPSTTGILMSNLPYIALALVAIGGLVAYVVVRRRQDDEA